MAERGAEPPVPPGRRLFLRAVRHLFSPLRPDDYLEMVSSVKVPGRLRAQAAEPAKWYYRGALVGF